MIEGAVAGSVVGVLMLLLVVLTIIVLVILFAVRKYEATFGGCDVREGVLGLSFNCCSTRLVSHDCMTISSLFQHKVNCFYFLFYR